MGIRHLACKLLVGGGVLSGLALGWAGIDSLCSQTTAAQEKTYRAPAPAPAPGETPVQRNYLNKNVIRLPIEISPAQRALVKEIQLYVKDSANTPWVLRETVDGTRDAFTFQAPRDGEYWFTMVTVDHKGRGVPANVQKEGPALIVIIDTQKPAVQLTNMGVAPEGQLVRCEVRDASLDGSRGQIYFQGGDNVFRTMVPVAGLANVYCVPTECVWRGVIRVTAEDMAGNRVEHEEHISKLQAQPTSQLKAQPQPAVTPPPMLPTDIRYVPPLPTIDKTPPSTPQKVRPDGSEGPRFENIQKTDYRAPAKRQLVNATKLFLDYQLENAGAGGGRVDVWITRDLGKSWHKLSQDSQHKSPVEVNLPGDGLFGITLVATSSRGVAANPPVSGDVPDGWIEVDTTKPAAHFTKLESIPENGLHSVHIHWSVKDANLGDAPVDMVFAATPQGPWLPIAKNLKAEGEHRWTPAKELGTLAHLRLIARDLAGNESVVASLEPVAIGEPIRPRAILRGISTGTSAPGAQAAPLPIVPLPQFTPAPSN